MNSSVNNLNKKSQSEAELMKKLADENYNNKDYLNAIKLYSDAIVLESCVSKKEAAILYSNRSLAYVKLYHQMNNNNDLKNENLECALNDAKQVIKLDDDWFKGYARLANIYKLLNDLELCKQNYLKAFARCPHNEEIKNELALVKHQISEQERFAHFDEQSFPKSTEERTNDAIEKLLERYGEKDSILTTDFHSLLEEKKNYLIEKDPTLEYVWKGHEYRDGSKKCEQNFELAAKYYAKAAREQNAEALYNLAQLTMKGLGEIPY
jgi:hypothetical protein